MRLVTAALGAIAGYVLLREHLARQGAERLSAAALETLLRAIDANDSDTGAHVRRVAGYALILADAYGLSPAERRTVEQVALFHDIGKIHEALFDIIHDEHRLTPGERRAIATHPARGAQVLAPLAPFFPELAEGVLAHHERWDGTGYPRGLAGRRIPLAARIVAIADTFDVITHGRKYRRGKTARDAADAIACDRGTQFDPDLVDLLLFPPVFEAVANAHRLTQQKAKPAERRRGRVEPVVPDVSFRWRTPALTPSRVDGSTRAAAAVAEGLSSG